jgi:large subunit ribosomal protein L25
MEKISLKASARDGKAKAKALRRDGRVPCVVYGSVEGNMHVECAERELHKAFAKAGESTLVELDVGGKTVPVLFKSVSFDPVTDREIHVDFYAVNMKKEIDTLVPVHFEGESPAVKELGGVFVITHDHVRVRCLPADLPHSLNVNVSGLAAFHQSVQVKDLDLPKGVKLMDEADTVLATIQEPRKEEEIAPAPAAATEGAAAPGAEGAPAAEGATPAAAAAAADAKAEKKDKK